MLEPVLKLAKKKDQFFVVSVKDIGSLKISIEGDKFIFIGPTEFIIRREDLDEKGRIPESFCLTSE